MAHTHNGVLLSLEKEGHSDSYSMDESGEQYAEGHKPDTKGQLLCDCAHMRSLEPSNPQRQTAEWQLQGAGGVGGDWGVSV